MERGQRVRLSERGLRYYTKTAGTNRKRTVDWASRVGTVEGVGTRKHVGWLYVRWDGNGESYFEPLPPTFFEAATQVVGRASS
jgi:hypothetical protein